MSALSIAQIADVWKRNGGDASHVVNAVAVCLAESGGDPRAISLSGDYGLWQINAGNWPALGLSIGNVYDPDVNCRAAIRLSRDGSDWGDWCTCYAPGYRCGSIHPMATPMPGSPANRKTLGVAGVLNPPQVDYPAPSSQGNTDNARTAFADFRQYLTGELPQGWADLMDVYNAIGRIWPG